MPKRCKVRSPDLRDKPDAGQMLTYFQSFYCGDDNLLVSSPTPGPSSSKKARKRAKQVITNTVQPPIQPSSSAAPPQPLPISSNASVPISTQRVSSSRTPRQSVLVPQNLNIPIRFRPTIAQNFLSYGACLPVFYSPFLNDILNHPPTPETIHPIENEYKQKFRFLNFMLLEQDGKRKEREKLLKINLPEVAIYMQLPKYFIYLYLDVKKLFGGPLTLRRFVQAALYGGKGEGVRDLAHVGYAIEDFPYDGCYKKWYAVKTAMEEDGVIVHVGFFYSSEIEALSREGGIIRLLQGQLGNHQSGQLPGIKLNQTKNMYCRAFKNTRIKNSKSRQYLGGEEGVANWAVHTMLHMFETFDVNNQVRITNSNGKHFVNADAYKIKTSSYQPGNPFARLNFLTDSNFSHTFDVAVENGIYDDHTTYADVNKSYAKSFPQLCFVFLYLDGSKIQKDINLNEISIKDYLAAIFAIGIEANPTNALLYLKNDGSLIPKNNILQKIKSQCDDSEVLIQIISQFSAEKQALLLKGSMLAALNEQFANDNMIPEIEKLSNKNITTTEDFVKCGTSCWFKAWKAFRSLPPNPLKPNELKYDEN